MTQQTMNIPIHKSTEQNIAAGIHNGDNTHHHDQAIYPVNFNVIKTIVSNPVKPIPPLEAEFDVFMIIPPKIYSIIPSIMNFVNNYISSKSAKILVNSLSLVNSHIMSMSICFKLQSATVKF